MRHVKPQSLDSKGSVNASVYWFLLYVLRRKNEWGFGLELLFKVNLHWSVTVKAFGQFESKLDLQYIQSLSCQKYAAA